MAKPFHKLIRAACRHGLFWSKEPYRLDDAIWVDADGLHLTVWCWTKDAATMTATQAVFQTLEANGIPGEVIDLRARVTVIGHEMFRDEANREVAGLRLELRFALTDEAAGWFDTEDGRIYTRLKVVLEQGVL